MNVNVNNGVQNNGSGDIHIGDNNRIGGSTGKRAARYPKAGDVVDVGILTVLRQEQRAIVEALRQLPGSRTERPTVTGPIVHRAEVGEPGDRLRIAAVQMVDRGTEAAGVAHLELVRALAPKVVLLVGVAGGVGPALAVGDVVLSDEVVLYDPRRVSEEGVHHRGRTYVVSAALRHRLNEFMVATDGKVRNAQGTEIPVWQGPIGSGSSVITNSNSEDRKWLLQFNEKLLAVETEAAGMAQAFYQVAGQKPEPFGWLTVRGISDTADAAKGHAYHELASRHAATVTMKLLSYLSFGEHDTDELP